MEYESDSGAETVMSEEENPMWHLFNAVKNYTSVEGLRIVEPFLKLPSKRLVMILGLPFNSLKLQELFQELFFMIMYCAK
ncbi:hypothetical protein DPMN_118648 [Dreissena polymorpha]|uniref:Uncharacterized protein n=1 Tax=Dreissena polymorpha TaxID=45954 RepID=A0A9D4GH66_DREPO|nr:hypothetical protein DPMN_118648 [Dreissena polymorpha]